MRIQSILAPTDFSETANHAVEQAVELSIRTRARLHLYHVVEPLAEESAGVVAAVRDYLESLEADAQKSLALKVEVLRGNDIDVHFSTARAVSPFEAIGAKVEELQPDLLVMGTHGRTGLERLLLGSVTEKTLRHVRVNVLSLGPTTTLVRSDRVFERILVPVDFSEPSRRAFAAAHELLVPGGEIVAVHVVASPIHPSFYAGGVTRLFQLDPEMPDRIRKSLSEWLEGKTEDLEVREGDVFAELMDVAATRDSQLLVMGTKGLTGLEHLLMGSVTERVVRRAKLPVLTVH